MFVATRWLYVCENTADAVRSDRFQILVELLFVTFWQLARYQIAIFIDGGISEDPV